MKNVFALSSSKHEAGNEAVGKIKFCQFPADFLIVRRSRCDVMVSAVERGGEDDEVRANSREWATVCAHRNLQPVRIDHQTDCNQTTLRFQRSQRLPWPSILSSGEILGS